MNRLELYTRAPLPVQNVMATAYGLRELPRRHGGRYRRYCSELAIRQWWSPEQLAADQDSRVQSMVTWCAARVPYYRDLFAELGLDAMDLRTAADLTALPILEKETVRAQPERFVPDGNAPRLIPQTTGGTTGTPLGYWATLDAVRFNYATYETRCRQWAGVRFGDRMASFHGQPIVPAATQDPPFWRRNPAFNQLYCSVYHLNHATLPAYIDELASFDPEVVVGYTSAVHRIATHLIDTDQVGRIRPRSVLVSSETLRPAARAEIETAFGCRVTNAYSLGELVAFVTECPEGDLHVSSEYGVLELVDVDGLGSTEIVATGLINRGMPLLRYRTGDLAVAAEPGTAHCDRGLPILQDLIGRIDDVVRTPEGAVVGPAPMSLAFQRVPNLRRAQVHQSSPEALDVLIETADGWTPDNLQFLERELRKRLGERIALRFEQVTELPRTRGGKERLVVSSIERTSS